MAPMAEFVFYAAPSGRACPGQRQAHSVDRKSGSASGSKRLEPDALPDVIYFAVLVVFGAFLR